MPTDRRTIVAWCSYDFANSAFTTLVVTFIYAAFFTKVIAPDEVTGTWLWSRCVSITAITVALLSPFLGALADRGGYRKRFLGFFTAAAVLGAAFLYTAMPGQVTKALVWFTVGNIAFEMGGVFYNAFLPDVAPPDRIGRVSGYGWALGYVGGLSALQWPGGLRGRRDPVVRPLHGRLPAHPRHQPAGGRLVRRVQPAAVPVGAGNTCARRASRASLADTLRQLVTTFREIRRYPDIFRLLLARLFYADGLNTVFAFGGIYAAGTFGFTFEELLVFGLVLNVAAGAGAFALGFVDDWLGGRRTIQISLLGFIWPPPTAILTGRRTLFWAAGILIGLCGGPNQAASRSLWAASCRRTRRTSSTACSPFPARPPPSWGVPAGELTRSSAPSAPAWPWWWCSCVIGLALVQRVDEARGKQRAPLPSPRT